jgi:hypothetical protein
MSEEKKSAIKRSLSFVVLGLLSGVVICGLSAFFTGAGHGWGSAMLASFSIVGAPLAGAAWSLRGEKIGKILGSVSVAIAIIGDFFLASNTVEEGFSYVAKVWDVMPIPMLVWAILFLGWQALAALAIFAHPQLPIQPPQTTTGSSAPDRV